MRRLVALLEKSLGVGWQDIVEWLRGQNKLAEIEARLVSLDYAGAIADVDIAAAKFADELHQAYVTSGQRAAKWLDAKVPDALIRFDATHSKVIQRARTNSYEQVSGLTQESREVVRRVVVEGVTTGVAPRETARRLRDSVGLTDSQERALSNYRRALESGDWSKAMGYELRDGRADRSMRRGMELTPKRIDELAERYRVNSINHRAETIARTESLRAAHEGADDAMSQSIERGDIDATQLETEWHAGPMTRYARLDHRKLDGIRVKVGGEFTLPDGVRMKHPGDPRGGAKHVANCRCTVSTTFVSLD